jgi:hypothetical protein
MPEVPGVAMGAAVAHGEEGCQEHLPRGQVIALGDPQRATTRRFRSARSAMDPVRIGDRPPHFLRMYPTRASAPSTGAALCMPRIRHACGPRRRGSSCLHQVDMSSTDYPPTYPPARSTPPARCVASNRPPIAGIQVDRDERPGGRVQPKIRVATDSELRRSCNRPARWPSRPNGESRPRMIAPPGWRISGSRLRPGF